MGLFGPPNIEKMKAARDVSGLIKALGYQKDENVALDAVRALGGIGGAQVIAPLCAALEYGGNRVPEAAIQLLGQLGDPRAVSALITKFTFRRDMVVEALTAIGAPAVPALIALLERTWENLDARLGAVWALGNIGDARAVEPLIARLEDANVYIRKGAAGALGQIGDPRAVPAVTVALKDVDRDVRQLAGKALEKIGWKPGRDHAGAVYWIARDDWDACVDIGAPAVNALAAVLAAGGYRGVKAARALERIGDVRAVPALIQALGSLDTDLRSTAAEVLGGMGDARAVEPLVAMLQDDKTDVRKGAAKALVRLYQSGKLDDAAKEQILAHREEMSRPHEDIMPVCIKPGFSHTDRGIGVDFPL